MSPVLPFPVRKAPSRRGPRTNPPGIVIPLRPPPPLRLETPAPSVPDDATYYRNLAAWRNLGDTLSPDGLVLMLDILQKVGESASR